MTELPDIPDDWKSQGWTAENAHKTDEEHSEAWGATGALETPADPSSVQHESEHAEEEGHEHG